MIPELVAFHESGHAVAAVMAFRTAPFLPLLAPRLPVRYVEIIDHGSGWWSGNCFSSDIYSVRWLCVEPRYRPLMEAQVTIELAGGIAEWIYRGEPVPVSRCGMDGDLQKAFALMDGDLRRVTGNHLDLKPFVDRTRALLTEHWSAVEALAYALVAEGRIEGERVQRIIDRSMIRRAS